MMCVLVWLRDCASPLQILVAVYRVLCLSESVECESVSTYECI
jgi:hypothetical protein